MNKQTKQQANQQTKQQTKQQTNQQTKQQANHRADVLNQNTGTSGTNKTNAQVHGNRGKQLNPNQIGN